jgi:NAD(P)-dependent dehydrogenase (short-subunit alcohol dehydrogenase family)
MTDTWRGSVALVTGASSGIGRATALAFAQRGARVVVADVAAEGGRETTRLIQEAGGEALFVACDVSQAAAVEALVAQAVAAFGRLDYACNNAGIEGAWAALAEYPEESWEQVLRVNLTGPYLCMKYEIPRMLEQGKGAIVNTASILGVVGLVKTAGYTAAKHGLVGITKTAALEYAAQGIRINAVCPAFIETPFVMERTSAAGSNAARYQHIANLHPMKRLGKPEEIAAAILWLCSDEASFITGHALMVDGGYTAQ